jgi:hypothetical protein
MLGGLVVEQPVLIRDKDVIAFITGITAYPAGFSFVARVEARWTREDDPTLDEWNRSNIDRNGLDLVVSFADGQHWHGRRDRSGGGLSGRGVRSSFGDTGTSHQAEYWLASLPSSGPVQFEITLEPPTNRGRSTSTTGIATVEGELLKQAARRAVDLWD